MLQVYEVAVIRPARRPPAQAPVDPAPDTQINSVESTLDVIADCIDA